MAELAEYQQWLRNAVANKDDPNNRYLAHLAQYGADAPLYGGAWQLGGLQTRYNSMTNGRDLGSAIRVLNGSDLGIDSLAEKDATDLAQTWVNQSYADKEGQEIPTAAATPQMVEQAKARILAGSGQAEIDPNKRYAYVTQDFHDFKPYAGPGYQGGKLIEVGNDFDPSKYSGYETIRPGELDNTINGLKDQLGNQFNESWDAQAGPALARLTPEQRQQAHDIAAKKFWEGVDWSQLIKYDPNIGMYTPMGAVKHVDDEGGGWKKYGGPIMQTIITGIAGGAFAGPLAAQAGATASGATAAGTTAGTAAGTTAGAATAGASTAGAIASAVTKALLSSAITSALSGRKLSGKSLAMGLLASGAGAGVGQLAANATGTAANGIPALLASGATRSLVMNRKLDPKLLALNTAGAYADSRMGMPVYSLANRAYGAYNTLNRLQSNNGQARTPVRLQGRNGGLLRTGVKP